MNKMILTIITFVPLIGALLTLLPWGRWLKLDKAREERLIKYGAIAISLLPLGLAIALWFGYNKAIGGMQFQVDVPWIPMLNINYHMGVDGLSVPLVFLTTFLTTLGLYYSSRVIKVRVREFFFLFLLLEMGMLGVFVSLDLVLFYVFWEVGLVPMYFLIGIWGQPKDRPQYSAIKFFLYTLTGSIFMLLAILGIYFTTGTFDMLEAARLQPFAGNVVLSSLAFFAFFLAFAIKVPSWPFHTWLPDAHTAAPTAGSVLLAGVLLKLGAYGILRILLPIFPEAFKRYAVLVIALGVISIIYGALVSMAQWDMKRLIAYSSVSHMGFVLLGVGAAAYRDRHTPVGRCRRDGAQRRGAANVQPWYQHRRLVLPGRRDLRASALPRPEDVRRVQQQVAVLLRLVCDHRFHFVGPARPGRFLERVLCLPGRVRHRADLGGHRYHRRRAHRGVHPVEDRTIHLPGPV